MYCDNSTSSVHTIRKVQSPRCKLNGLATAHMTLISLSLYALFSVLPFKNNSRNHTTLPAPCTVRTRVTVTLKTYSRTSWQEPTYKSSFPRLVIPWIESRPPHQAATSLSQRNSLQALVQCKYVLSVCIFFYQLIFYNRNISWLSYKVAVTKSKGLPWQWQSWSCISRAYNNFFICFLCRRSFLAFL